MSPDAPDRINRLPRASWDLELQSLPTIPPKPRLSPDAQRLLDQLTFVPAGRHSYFKAPPPAGWLRRYGAAAAMWIVTTLAFVAGGLLVAFTPDQWLTVAVSLTSSLGIVWVSLGLGRAAREGVARYYRLNPLKSEVATCSSDSLCPECRQTESQLARQFGTERWPRHGGVS